jgi:hypothetical protein
MIMQGLGRIKAGTNNIMLVWHIFLQSQMENKLHNAKLFLPLAIGLGCAWLGLAWLGLAWLGLAWQGLARLGKAWLGLARLGLAWLDLAGHWSWVGKSYTFCLKKRSFLF